jgi:hypothetical protein
VKEGEFIMRKFVLVSSMITALILAVFNSQAAAQTPYRVPDRQVQQLLTQLELHTDTFRNSLTRGLNRTRFNGTATESEINGYVDEFNRVTNQLRDRFGSRQAASTDVDEVLTRGWHIDNFMRTNRLGAEAEREWATVRTDLQTLARYYNVTWRWNDRAYNPSSNRPDNRPDNRYDNSPRGYDNQARGDNYRVGGRLTGTYTLDTTRSDDVMRAAERATAGMDAQEAERVRASLQRRLEAPERLALEQRGRSVTIVSTSAPQATIEASGRSQTETRPNGRVVNTKATLTGNTLVVNSTGDRGSDFNVTFEPLNGGRQLRVTKSIFSERVPQGIEVRSIYNRTSDVAQLNIYEGSSTAFGDPRPGQDRGVYDRRTGSFSIPNDTVLVATLNEGLSTSATRDGERFTMTVQSPGPYRNAIIEGYVLKTDRSGRLTGHPELTLDFQRVRLNGRDYDFAGIIEGVRTANGDSVRVDNEGSVREKRGQTEKTVTRSGIGAALGAIIGGIAGGGSGAAIGAAVGAGAGAGTVLVQGRDNLELVRGTEFTIRSSAPRQLTGR